MSVIDVFLYRLLPIGIMLFGMLANDTELMLLAIFGWLIGTDLIQRERDGR
jgi:hypothetical protein